jgi:Na+-translocating ferredoxin:NAD+ oxidoreductase RnfE subunit
MTGPTARAHERTQLPPGILLLLALAPVLAPADSALDALWLGIAIVLLLAIVGTASRLADGRFPGEVRLGVVAVLAASLVAMLDRGTAAFLPDVHAALGQGLPLVAASSLALAGGTSFQRKAQAARLPAAGLATGGLACLVVLVVLGAAREWLGAHAQLALHPAGAFLLLGAGLAAFNGWRARRDPTAVNDEGAPS